MRKDPVRVALHLLVFVALAIGAMMLFGWALASLGYLIGMIGTSLLAAGSANWLALRIFEGRSLIDAGLWWNRASSRNLWLGLAGGACAAALVLAPQLLIREAYMTPVPPGQPSFGSLVFITVMLAAGVLAEELLFRGYGFQILLGAAGAYAAILPVAVLFALVHSGNPNATWLGLVNTGGFGVLFGYAYLRSRDLWLPMGLHLGWNVTLPLFGVNLSGLRMRMTGYEMVWSGGPAWSGGAYGPEAAVPTAIVIVLLGVFLWKAPVRRQVSPISDPPVERPVCEPSPPSLS